MLPITRQLINLSSSYKHIYKSRNAIICKVNFCTKKEDSINVLAKSTKDGTVDISKKSSRTDAEGAEVNTLAFANDEEILQTVHTEKEKDANVRSRLSKECNTLLDKSRMRIRSSGLNLHLQDTTKNTCWEDYMFDKTIDNIKTQPTLPLISPMAEMIGVKEVGSNASKPAKDYNTGAGSSGDSREPTQPIERIIRQDPGQVLFAFIPIEWFQFFFTKTGVTGFGTFLFTFSMFLVSKEYFVLEHNYYNGLGMFFLCWGSIKYVGPYLAKYLDKEIDDYENSWQKGREQTKESLNEQIEDERLMQFQADGQMMLIEAKRENVHLQLEENFRMRQMMVYQEVLNRLNYHVTVDMVRKRIFHKNLVDYVTKEVRKSITPEMEKDLINISINDLVKELEKK